VKVRANGIEIEVESHGRDDGEPLLLVMGLGMQLIAWPDELVERLVRDGFRVIRFDNRDSGLSQGFDERGIPNLLWAALRHHMGLGLNDVPYTLDDMADDAAGVLDALGVGSAHVCGASMGGMVAQAMAARHPGRVRSLTLMMTSSGARHLPRPSWKVERALLSRPAGRSVQAVVDHLESFFLLIGSPGYPPERSGFRRRLETAVRRAYRPAGTSRQLVAIAAHGDRTPLLERIEVAATVIHGRDDPLVPVAAGLDLQHKIRGATIDVVDGMGHDLALALLPRYARSIAEVAARAA
jgi:pimeloyl-ACP methyl ester carboxylesterase